MKKILAVVGSNNKKSVSVDFLNEIMEQVTSRNSDIEYEVIHLSENNIKFCQGCNNCFMNGKCPLDKHDAFDSIKKKLLKSDIIIFSTPIYFGNVSGIMKNFLDRISYMTHTLKLRGKNSIAISTNQSNNHTVAIDYLESCLTFLGSNVIHKLNASSSYPEQLNNEEWRKSQIVSISRIILENIDRPNQSNSNLEKIYINTKTIMSYYKKQNINTYETNYWENHGFFEKNSFQEILDEKNRNDNK